MVEVALSSASASNLYFARAKCATNNTLYIQSKLTPEFKTKGPKMKNLLSVVSLSITAAAATSGCGTTTGIVKISEDTFMLAKQDMTRWSGSGVKVELYKEANGHSYKFPMKSANGRGCCALKIDS